MATKRIKALVSRPIFAFLTREVTLDVEVDSNNQSDLGKVFMDALSKVDNEFEGIREVAGDTMSSSYKGTYSRDYELEFNEENLMMRYGDLIEASDLFSFEIIEDKTP